MKMTASEIAERLEDLLKGEQVKDCVKAWVFHVQRDAAHDRLAIALAAFHEMAVWCDVDGDTDAGDEWRELEQILIGGDSEALRVARDRRRKFGYYKASLNRVKNWSADGVAAAARKQQEKNAA